MLVGLYYILSWVFSLSFITGPILSPSACTYGLYTSLLPAYKHVVFATFFILSETFAKNGDDSVAKTAMRDIQERIRQGRVPTKSSTIIITGVRRVSYCETSVCLSIYHISKCILNSYKALWNLSKLEYLKIFTI